MIFCSHCYTILYLYTHATFLCLLFFLLKDNVTFNSKHMTLWANITIYTYKWNDFKYCASPTWKISAWIIKGNLQNFGAERHLPHYGDYSCRMSVRLRKLRTYLILHMQNDIQSRYDYELDIVLLKGKSLLWNHYSLLHVSRNFHFTFYVLFLKNPYACYLKLATKLNVD